MRTVILLSGLLLADAIWWHNEFPYSDNSAVFIGFIFCFAVIFDVSEFFKKISE